MAYSSEAEYVGFEFSSSLSEGADSVVERMLTAEELFYDGKLRPLGNNYEWRAPSKQKAADACPPHARDLPSPTFSSSPSMVDAQAEDGPEAGRSGPLRVVKDNTEPVCADEMAFNASEWICFSPLPAQAEIDSKADDTENRGVSGHSVGDSYLHPRSTNTEERACLYPLSTNRSLHAQDVAGQGAKANKQSLPNANIKQAMTESLSSNRSVTQDMAVARARRLLNVSKSRLKLVQSNSSASTAQVSCLSTSTSTSTSSSSSSSSSASTCSSITCSSFSSTPLQPPSSSSSSALVSSLLFALSVQSSTFFTSPSSPPFSPITSSALHATPSSPPSSAFTASSMLSSSSSSSLFSNIEKKHPSLSSPSRRSSYCSCSCRFPIGSLWPFSRYKESLYSYLQSAEYVSLKCQENGRKKDVCIASKDRYPPAERKQMRQPQHTKAVMSKTNSKHSHASSKCVNNPTVVGNEQKPGGDCGQMSNSASDGCKGSPTRATRAKKTAVSGDSKVMQMGFREYTRKRDVSTPAVRVTPILSIVPGCMGPSLSKTRPKTTKAFM